MALRLNIHVICKITDTGVIAIQEDRSIIQVSAFHRVITKTFGRSGVVLNVIFIMSILVLRCHCRRIRVTGLYAKFVTNLGQYRPGKLSLLWVRQVSFGKGKGGEKRGLDPLFTYHCPRCKLALDNIS